MFKKRNKLKFFSLFVSFVLVVGIFTVLGLGGALAGTANITSPSNVILFPCESVSDMSVTWWDAENIENGQVIYGTNENLEDAATVTAEKNVDGDGYTSFEATMTNLSPATTYYYKVGNGNAWSEIYSFSTEDTDTEKFSFLYLGDVQYADINNAQAEYDKWSALVTNAAENYDLSFALMGGDMIQQSTNVDNWNMFLNAASDNFSALPMLAVTGNHEINASTGTPDNMKEYMSLPANGPTGFDERIYSYDYGNCHITVLDSNVFDDICNISTEDLTSIKNWLKNDLASSDAKWKIVALHHPAYAVVSDEIATQVMENWVDVFEEAQVDLVLCGHQHIYMRTYPMYKGKINQNGITYVMGNSGSKFYAKADVFYSEKMIENTSTYQVIEIDGDTLNLKTCDEKGSVLDTVTLNSRNRDIPIPDIESVTGDVNGDGSVTSGDYDIIINAILNCTTNKFMDINADGKVNIADAHYVKNIIDGRENYK